MNPCDFKDPGPTVQDRHVHGERTEHVRQPDGAQDSTITPSISGTGSLRETTRLQGQATSPSLRSKVYAARVKTCAWRTTAHLHPCCALRTSLRVSDSPDKAQHQLSPSKLNPDPMLHLIQHHLTLLHASSRGNDRIDSSDLLDSGG